MSFPRRCVSCLAVAAMTLLAAVPVASASTAPGRAHPMNAIPSDCAAHTVGAGVTMTCTARPPTQEWEVGADCWIKVGVAQPREGNTVTGDGTSTIATCLSPSNVGFIPLT
jgi:hypothetical protein